MEWLSALAPQPRSTERVEPKQASELEIHANLAAFDTRLDDLGMKFLHAIDTDMHRREMERAPGERTVRMGVGVYRFEDDGTIEPAPALNERRHSRRTGRRKGRRSG